MLVELIHIEVHTASTRTFTVPRYEVPIIRALWEAEVRKGYQKGWKITEFPTGMWEARQLFDEGERLIREYNSDAGSGKPVWQDFYGSPGSLQAAWEKAVNDCTALRERLAAQAAEEAEDQAAEDGQEAEATTADDGKPKKKGGQSRKPTPEPVPT